MKAVLEKIFNKHQEPVSNSDSFRDIHGFVTKTVTPKNSLIAGRVIAFNLDDTSVQMAAVSHFGHKRKILDIRSVSIPPASDSQDRSELIISEAISDFIKQFATRGTRITLSVSGVETAYRIFFMPILKKNELRKAVLFEMRNQIPFPADTCYHDYRALFKVLSKDKQRYRVAVVAANKAYIDKLLSHFGEHDIEITHIYLSQDALGQLLRELPDFGESKNYALAHLKRNSTEIAFYRGSSLEFSTVLSTGSSILHSMDETNIDYFTETVISEISVALDYYTGQFSRNDINKIYLYGNIPYTDLLVEKLNTRNIFQFASFPVDTLSLTYRSRGPETEQLLTCLPTLATAYCKEKLANLLPESIQNEIKQKSITSYARALLMALSVSLLLGWQGMKARTEVYSNSLADEQTKINIFESSKYFHTYKMLKQQIANDRAYLTQIQKEPSYLNLSLKMLSRLTPDEMWLYHLNFDKSYQKENLILHGIIKSNDIPPEVILAEYSESLTSSPLFEDVFIARHVKKYVKNHFELDFTIKLKAII